MSSKSLNQMILSAIEGADIDEDTVVDVESEKVAHTQERPAAPITSDIEKVASALEFVGNRGIESFIDLEKMAKAHGMGGKNPEVSHSAVSGKNEAYEGGYGSSEKRTHHPAVASNEAAQKFDPAKARNILINPVLQKLLANANKDSIHSNSSTSKGGGKGYSDEKEPKAPMAKKEKMDKKEPEAMKEPKEKKEEYSDDKKKMIKEALAAKLAQKMSEA